MNYKEVLAIGYMQAVLTTDPCLREHITYMYINTHGTPQNDYYCSWLYSVLFVTTIQNAHLSVLFIVTEPAYFHLSRTVFIFRVQPMSYLQDQYVQH